MEDEERNRARSLLNVIDVVAVSSHGPRPEKLAEESHLAKHTISIQACREGEATYHAPEA